MGLLQAAQRAYEEQQHEDFQRGEALRAELGRRILRRLFELLPAEYHADLTVRSSVRTGDTYALRIEAGDGLVFSGRTEDGHTLVELVGRCSSCGAEHGAVVHSLADVGRLLATKGFDGQCDCLYRQAAAPAPALERIAIALETIATLLYDRQEASLCPR